MNTETSRQLVAILFADIAGYTSMMQKDEQNALVLLNRFKEELESNVPPYRGDIIQYYGDGCLVVFRNSLDAISYARSLQEAFLNEPRVPVRIGVHLGDVIFKEGNVFGDSVNITSRIESMGVPGAVLFSQNVRNQIANQPEFEITALGNFDFKNVIEPVPVYALANGRLRVPKREEMKGKLKKDLLDKSVAVLPFANMSGNPEEEYFSDGITEEIIHALTQLKNLQVTGRTSAFSFKGQDIDLREVGQKLNVGVVLEGSVRKAGNRVRITAQLIKVADGFHLWSERYDRELTDIFAVQDEIAQTIASKLKATLFDLPVETASPKTTNMEAYQLYLKGRFFQSRRLEGYPKAIECFQKALELDPGFALPHYGIGIIYFYMAAYGMVPPGEGYPKARELALKAQELDENIAEVYMLLAGLTFCYDRNWEAALDYIERAFALNPSELEIYKGMTMIQLTVGNIGKAVSFGKSAMELEPLNPDAGIELVYCYILTKQYEEAFRLTDEMIDLDPKYSEAYRLKGAVHLRLAEPEKAISYFEKASELAGGEGFAPIYLAMTKAQQGHPEQAKAMLSDLLEQSAHSYVPPLFLSWICASLNEMDEAFNHLDKAFTIRDGMVPYLNVEPAFDYFRKDPRFENYIKKLNLPG